MYRQGPFWRIMLLYFAMGLVAVILHNIFIGDVDGSSWVAGIVAYAGARFIEDNF